MKKIPLLAELSDGQLLEEVERLARNERDATARLVASLAELDARRLYLGEGCSSLFIYCTRVLHFSEHAAYGRINAARAARKFPLILDLLGDGSIHLTAVDLLARHLTPDNHRALLQDARHKSKREIEHLIARLHPQPSIPAVVRKLPAPKPAESSRMPAPPEPLPDKPPVIIAAAPPAARPAVVRPLAPERYKLQVTISREAYDKLRRAQDLLRHSIPSGDPAAVVERALALLVAELEKRRVGGTNRPRTGRATAAGSRHVPAAVRRDVWARDGGQCRFVGANGRCTERGFLEFHHVVPYAAGGRSTADNLQLRCRAHNAYEAEQYFGSMFVRERNSVRTEHAVTQPTVLGGGPPRGGDGFPFPSG